MQVGAVLYMFADWYKTPWDKIVVDVLIEETKKLAKEVKTLNKAVSHCTARLFILTASFALATALGAQ